MITTRWSTTLRKDQVTHKKENKKGSFELDQAMTNEWIYIIYYMNESNESMNIYKSLIYNTSVL